MCHTLVLSLSLLFCPLVLPSLPHHLLLPTWFLFYFQVQLSARMLLNLRVSKDTHSQSPHVIKLKFLQRVWARPREMQAFFLEVTQPGSKSGRHSQSPTYSMDVSHPLGSILPTRSSPFLAACPAVPAAATAPCSSSGCLPFPAPQSNPKTSRAARSIPGDLEEGLLCAAFFLREPGMHLHRLC